MVTSTQLMSAAASWQSGLGVISLVDNSGTPGYTNFKIYNKLTGGSYIEVGSGLKKCIGYIRNNYITELYDIAYVTAAVGKLDFAMIRSYPCTSGNDCSVACGSYSSSISSQNIDIMIDYAPGVIPGPITGLTLTPGNGTIQASWTAPSNVPVYCYGLTLYAETVKYAGGYTFKKSIPIANLTNGTLYTIYVQPVSYDYLFSGTITSGSETPIAPCTQPSCTMTIV